MIDLPKDYFPKPLSEIKTIDEAVQSAMNCDTVYDAVGFVCMWEEYRRTGTIKGEPCFGIAVTALLAHFGINVRQLGGFSRKR